MFAVWNSYGMRDCTDGSSNTIAFAEALTGQDSAASGRRAIRLRATPTGATCRKRQQPRRRRPGADDPAGLLRGGCPVSDGFGQRGRSDSGLQACATAWTNQATASYSSMRGFSWADG